MLRDPRIAWRSEQCTQARPSGRNFHGICPATRPTLFRITGPSPACTAPAYTLLGLQAVARLTGDNVVLLLRVRAAEEAAAAAASERDMLRLAVEERRGPWFDQARPLNPTGRSRETTV